MKKPCLKGGKEKSSITGMTMKNSAIALMMNILGTSLNPRLQTSFSSSKICKHTDEDNIGVFYSSISYRSGYTHDNV